METFKTKILNHNIKKLKQPKLQTAKKNLQLQERKIPFRQQLPSKQFNLLSYYKNKQHYKIIHGFKTHNIKKYI